MDHTKKPKPRPATLAPLSPPAQARLDSQVAGVAAALESGADAPTAHQAGLAASGITPG